MVSGKCTKLTTRLGSYDPPDCSFNRVTINFTVTSAGRQFDRLALMFLDDTEVFRTSTAEPTRNGIVWTYIKDMSNFLTLFKQTQKIIFDLGNLVDDTYTGSWNTTLTATFFTEEETFKPADVIIPVSAHRSTDNSPSAFVVPENRAVNTLTIPRNTQKAVFTISACGQATEEFWWSNVLSSDTLAFGNDTTLYGHSAFRELRLLIDGNLAGVAWPFPVIFTGGVVPGFWRPIVGIDAFDLREDEIDIAPFLPLLNDGLEHTFEIQVVGIDDDGHGNAVFTSAIGSNWVVTGKIFVWLGDNEVDISIGSVPIISSPDPVVFLRSMSSPGSDGTSKTLDYSVEVTRNLHIQSSSQSDPDAAVVSWTQNLTFTNVGILSNSGNNQIVRQRTAGTNKSPSASYERSASYPLDVVSSYDAPTGGNVSINATMGRGKNVQQAGDLAFPNDWKTFDFTRLPSYDQDTARLRGSVVQNWQNGTASYFSVPAEKRSHGFGTTEQFYVLSGVSNTPFTVIQNGFNTKNDDGTSQRHEELYRRKIVARNDSIVYDDETFGGDMATITRQSTLNSRSGLGKHEFATRGIRALLGRGPL